MVDIPSICNEEGREDPDRGIQRGDSPRLKLVAVVESRAAKQGIPVSSEGEVVGGASRAGGPDGIPVSEAKGKGQPERRSRR